MANVLVVDDEEGLRFTIAKILKDAGHAIVAAEDVPTARAACDSYQPDVVLTDLALPGESGLDLLRWVREHSPRAQVVMVTGEPTLDSAMEALRLGAFDYLPKPVARDALVSVTGRAARMKEVLDENARLLAENLRHREDLERQVEDRTRQLREREHQYRLLAENVADVIFSVGFDLRITYVSPSVVRVWGRPVEELRAALALDVFLPSDRASLEGILAEELALEATPAGGEDKARTRSIEATVLRPDGVQVPVELCMRFLRDESGTAIGVVGMARDISERRAAQDRLKESLARMEGVLQATIEAMATTVEKRDPYTAGHQRRVSNLARTIAARMGLSPDDVDGVRMAALVHDVGKISVPSEILVKPGRLSITEMQLMRMHCEAGYEILKDIQFAWPVADAVYQHHERCDGSGYPRGIAGDDLVLGARILGVADVVEAMASHRPYRPALGIDAALDEIASGRGRLYHPDVVDACIAAFREDGFAF